MTHDATLLMSIQPQEAALATRELTPRQQELKALMDQGMKVKEIAAQVGISENAVYQQQARIRKATGDDGGSRPRRTTARRSRRPSEPPFTVERHSTRMAMTPVEAIQARREEIELEVGMLQRQASDARVAWEELQRAYEERAAEHLAELKALDVAESALTGTLEAPRPAAKRTRTKPSANFTSTPRSGGSIASGSFKTCRSPTRPGAIHEPYLQWK